MNKRWLISASMLATFIMSSCSTGTVTYDLPSAGTAEKPEWVVTHKAARDSIFVMINLPNEDAANLDQSVQKAQSELHTILVNELEIILRDYWNEQNLNQSDTELFEELSKLPLSIEHIMTKVVVADGWERSGEVAILCALDYEMVAEILMADMNINDTGFFDYFKGRMDDLSKRYH